MKYKLLHYYGFNEAINGASERKRKMVAIFKNLNLEEIDV